jgi:hypothetical protein
MSQGHERFEHIARLGNQARERTNLLHEAQGNALNFIKYKLEKHKVALTVTVSITALGVFAIARSRRDPQKFLRVDVIEQKLNDPKHIFARISRMISPGRSKQIWPTATQPEALNAGDNPMRTAGEISVRGLIRLLQRELSTPPDDS